MNKVVNTFWTDSRLSARNPAPRAISGFGEGREAVREKIRTRAARRRNGVVPRWFIFTLITTLTFLVCLTVNIRTRSQMLSEIEKQQNLNADVARFQSEVSALSEEVSKLQTDSATIERAARERLGMGRPNEKRIIVSSR